MERECNVWFLKLGSVAKSTVCSRKVKIRLNGMQNSIVTISLSYLSGTSKRNLADTRQARQDETNE